MAIIPLGPLTIPSIRKLLINRPGLPAGKFWSEPPPLVSLPNRGAKGSRREMFSRSAVGFMARATTGVGTSGVAAVTSLALGPFAVELAAATEEGLLGGALGLTPTAPSAGFGPGVAPGAGLAGALVAGLALTLAPAGPAGELPEVDAGFDASDTGWAGEVVGGTGFGACAFGAAGPAEAACFAGATFVPVVGLTGAG